ncbi:FAD-dependent oxidoreductase [Candidatus Marinamargulisbacteria bacterium SCGC AG-333-B06]|nr:FAD-dependent oxidoreductase [Candidatus Marinamargulisbacteria bacterium SCGC AG-333-B06]
MKSLNKNKVIIVGGGFGGCAAAKKLAKNGFEVMLFDKRNHHVFQPLLYQVATAMLSPAQIAYPIRSMFRKIKNVRVLIGNVSDINKEDQYISLKRSSQKFQYDYLIIAAGARHSYFGNPEWEKLAWGLKTTKDALKIRERMLYSFEKAERTRSKKKREKFSTFVIVGAGPTGVEMAGAIAEVTQKSIVSDFTEFNSKISRIILIEGSDRVLNQYPKELSDKAKKDLEHMGVEIKLNSFVNNITEKGVFIGDILIETENIIWAAGNTSSPLIKNITNQFNPMGQANVNLDFSIKEDSCIFCIGDCAYLKDRKGNVVPAVAQGAIQAGKFVARQIINDQKNKNRQKFMYLDKGSMATIGRSRAIAYISGFKFSGFFAWALWGIIHILFLVDMRNKVLVLLDWVTSYFTHKRSVRLINMYRSKSKL